MASIYFLSGAFIRLWFAEKLPWHTCILSLLSVWVVWNLKYYFAAIFFAVVITLILYKLITAKFALSKIYQYALWLVLFIIPLAIATSLHPNFSPQRFFRVITDNHEAFKAISSPTSLVHFHDLQPTFMSILKNTPTALFSGLFRPFVWEAENILALMMSIENLIVLFLAAVALASIRKMIYSKDGVLIFSVIVYVFFLAVFLCLSTPNFGTLSRYRVGYYPFFVFVLLLTPGVSAILKRTFSHFPGFRS